MQLVPYLHDALISRLLAQQILELIRGSDGTPIHTFKKEFMTLIAEAGVAFDRDGQRRTIYSLRHTYATFRLQEGVNHFVLARNMGTSVKMPEQFYGHVSNRAMAGELTKSRTKEKKKLPWE
jgi:integrase